jgi:D-sedoheptulose 7-phosphate isomerase
LPKNDYLGQFRLKCQKIVNKFIKFRVKKFGRYTLKKQTNKLFNMHTKNFFNEVISIATQIDIEAIDKLAQHLKDLRDRGGRLFLLGVGGSAGNCSHAVNDFRKLCGIEAYAPIDNVSELTARTNDEGWDSIFSGWLKVSKANSNDAILVFSVGGGNLEKNVSPNIVQGLKFAKERGLQIYGVVGRDGGYTKQVGDCVIVIPTVDASRVTPHAEAFQGVVWHCLVSNPILQETPTKW